MIQYSLIFYQWLRDILDSAEVNNELPENHQQTLFLILILRTLWPSRILEPNTTYQRNRRLTTVLSRSINLHTLPNYPHKRADAELHHENLQGDKNTNTYPSSSTEDRRKVLPRFILNILYNKPQWKHHTHLRHVDHHHIPIHNHTGAKKIYNQCYFPAQVVKDTKSSKMMTHQRPQ